MAADAGGVGEALADAGVGAAPCLFNLAFNSAALALAAAMAWVISGLAPGVVAAGVVGRGEPSLDLARF